MEPENTPEGWPATQSPHVVCETRAVLLEHGVTLRAVSRAAGQTVNYRTVYRVLDPATARKVQHGATVTVRRAAERLLRARGWTGDPAALWAELDGPAEYDAPAREAA